MKTSGKLRSAWFHFIEWQIRASILLYVSRRGAINILQVGSNDGHTIDPLHQVIKRKQTKAIVVEAVPYIFKKLQHTYQKFPGVKPLNVVVTSDPAITETSFYYFKSKDGQPIAENLSWWGSLSKSYTDKYTRNNAYLRDLLVCENLPCTTLNELYKRSGFGALNILHTDVEGFDGELINSIDFSLVKPELILFEHYHLEKSSARGLIKKLTRIGYRCYSHGYDTMCIDRTRSAADFLLRLIKWIRPSLLSPVKS